MQSLKDQFSLPRLRRLLLRIIHEFTHYSHSKRNVLDLEGESAECAAG